MTRALAFVGDEIEAAAFRLAGALAITPAPGEETAALRRGCEQAAVVVLAAACAARIEPQVLETALRRTAPMIVLLPGQDGATPAMDPLIGVRRQLGAI